MKIINAEIPYASYLDSYSRLVKKENIYMKCNDLNLKNWKKLDINVDSLWLIDQRDKTGKHSNIYHGNFIPQIPNQLIKRYTKENEIILDPFLGSGTTLFEFEKLNRKFIGFDINNEMIEYVKSKMQDSETEYQVSECDVTDNMQFKEQTCRLHSNFCII